MADATVTLLEDSIAEARRQGRDDLVRRLTAERDQLTAGTWNVLVAGEFKAGKSAFVNALLGVEICGADPVDFTQVPTFVRYGPRPRATLLPSSAEVPVRAAARYARTGLDPHGERLTAVEVELPRALLREGLVLIDTPGLGGGFAGAQAAATMRAMSMADAVIVVCDASQEYTAADVELLTRAAELGPQLLAVLTKTDFYPEWPRIRDLNLGHLRDAGLDLDILPVSSLLRECAIDDGDRALNAESGFPDVVRRLRRTMRTGRAGRSAGRAAAAARSSLSQVADMLATEQAALVPAGAGPPAERPAPPRVPGNRWLNLVNDRFDDIRAHVEQDLQQRTQALEEEVTERVRTADPAKEWGEILPWVYERTNDELTQVHASMLDKLRDVDREIAELFALETTDVTTFTRGAGPPGAGDAFKLGTPGKREAGRLEIGMQAARGWSLSSSVVTTVLVATLHPGLLVVLPITVALGSAFAWKAVRGYKSQRLEQARNEALRMVASYLHHARSEAARSAASILRHSRSGMRDFYQDRAEELQTTAMLERAALQRGPGDPHRATESARELERVRALLRTAEQLLGPAAR
jgi:GTP-binding protein EngB required for normal cell division